jgi:hypothetical protein
VLSSLCIFGVAVSGDDQTSVTSDLNIRIARNKNVNDLYHGGKGVLIRAVNDGLSGPLVVPATFIVNDIMPPSTMYPADGNPMCPSPNGNSGYNQGSKCTDDPFARAQVGIVVGTAMPNLFKDFASIQDDKWGNGVFYGTDSNSVDQRCFYSEQYDGYDCPGGWVDRKSGKFAANSQKQGAGYRPAGNPIADPNAGGGAGCHFSVYNNGIDQFDAYNGNSNIVRSASCECNYDLSGNSWQDWVNQWIEHGQSKPGYEWMGWFDGGKKKAPNFAMDIAACWVNNPRSMIGLQNAMWSLKDNWNNLLMPQSVAFKDSDPASQRRYWGWNEVPVDASQVNSPENWDAFLIKLPAAACNKGNGQDDTIDCLPSDSLQKLEDSIDWYVSNKLLLLGAANVGKRPGSYTVFLREYYTGNKQWERQFYCAPWNSPRGKYSVSYNAISANDQYGGCFIDHGTAPPPTPAPPGKIGGAPIHRYSDDKKCIDIPQGSLNNGNRLQLWDCNGIRQNQNWEYMSNTLRAGVSYSKCMDFDDMKEGTQVQLYDCDPNRAKQQYVEYSSHWYNSYPYSYRTKNGLCLIIPNGNKGSPIKLAKCKSWPHSRDEQEWSSPHTGLFSALGLANMTVTVSV